MLNMAVSLNSIILVDVDSLFKGLEGKKTNISAQFGHYLGYI